MFVLFPCTDADDASAYRRLYRCAEMIQKSTTKILQTSVHGADSSSSSCSLLGSSMNSSQSINSSTDTSILSHSQLQLLDIAAQEMKLASNGLILAVKSHLDKNEGTAAEGGAKLNRSPSKASSLSSSKRMLPISPTKRSGSFRSSPGGLKQGRVKRMAALVDLAATSSS